jgi:hypothetical protein
LISQIETGVTRYSQSLLEALGTALDCRPGDIINFAPDDPNAIQPLWDCLDDASKQMFRQLMELKVDATDRSDS